MVAKGTQTIPLAMGSSPIEAMTISEAAGWVARETGSRRPHVSTLLRWILKGVRGVQLPARRVGAKYWIAPGDLARFLDELNAPSGRPHQGGPSGGTQRPAPSALTSLRQRQVEAACNQLERLCGLAPQARRGEQSLASKSTL